MNSSKANYMTYPYPSEPGVYLMKDNNQNVIYIGKAKNLKKRIKSYFTNSNSSSLDRVNWKTNLLVSRIKNIDYIITDNEIEAFLLESNLIKKYRPIFNIELKDQQRYTYLRITDEKFPRLKVARRNRNGEFTETKGEIIGPFVKGSSRYLSVGLLRKMFKIRICNTLPKKECLEYHIGNCDAPCINMITEEKYKENIISLKKILKNNDNLKSFYNELENEMKIASEMQDYEKAIYIRDTLHRLKNILQYQKMENNVSQNTIEEYIGIIEDNNEGAAHVMTLMSKNGVINDMKKYQFDLLGDNTIESFISQYYLTSSIIPSTIYINREIEEKEKLQEILFELTNVKMKIIPIREEIKIEDHLSENNLQNKWDIMQLILSNLRTYMSKRHEPELDELMHILNLSKLPYVIDCFDVSNFGNEYAVGACTRFVNSIPSKNGYRRFKIKSINHQNDFGMIEEIVKRRYGINEKSDQVFSEIKRDRAPDLIVIDGGKGHLNVALKTLEKIGLGHIECISLAKENEEIYTRFSDKPVVIPKNQKSLKILQHIRDESHRFGLNYNIALRRKKLIQ
ncbi:excinuclease ABC subunit UvrC [Candidatus Nitrosocosmicus franklandus]|nr:excinuclease ABC subunit UvrC [Candidatus Nitrosocosmicus franklandus]